MSVPIIYIVSLTIAFWIEHIVGQYGIQLSSNTKSFTSAIKSGHINAGIEQTLFESKSGESGVITEQWSGGGAFYDAHTIISIYIDNEQTPSIQYNLLLGHGMGFSAQNESTVISQNGPFGTKYISHEASKGGLSHRYIIPFTNSIRITGKTVTSGTFWYWVHGIYNFPVVVTDFHIQLPNNTKLILYKQENVLLKALDFITLAQVNNSAGLIFSFVISANSSDFTYLEGCMRIKIDDNEVQFLSSGTEDIFESSYYFDAGVYHDDEVGLTYKAKPGMMSAYKFFMADPMIFTKSMSLIWRSGETNGVSNNNGCPNKFDQNYNNTMKSQNYDHDNLKDFSNPMLADNIVTTYAWVYQYQL